MQRRWLWALAGAAAGYGLYRLFYVPQLAAPPVARPAAGYDDAMARARRLQDRDGPDVNPLCRTKLYTHGAKTAQAFVLLHGFTNCPQQYVRMAEELHAERDEPVGSRGYAHRHRQGFPGQSAIAAHSSL